MPRNRKNPDPDLRDVPYEEEQAAEKEFMKDLRKRGWKRQEIEAAQGGWEWAFDTGFDQPELDSDAAGDMADMYVEDEPKFWRTHGGKGGCADSIYEGISAARKLQGTPAPAQVPFEGGMAGDQGGLP